MNLAVADHPVRLIRFGTYEAPVKFDDCDDLLLGFKSILRGWDVVEVQREETASPIIRFGKRNGWFFWRSKHLHPPKGWRPHGPRKVMDAVADFHYRFLDWHSQEFTEQFCLHCAAVEMNGGLVIFPSIQKAGKSTLVAELAMKGYRIYCDDVLPIDPENTYGIAMGILPRLRLPLPQSLSKNHLKFVNSRIGLSDRFAAYIDLQDTELAVFGASAPIRAIILLQRQTEAVPAKLSKAGSAQSIAKLIDQNFARHLSPTRIFDSMLSIVENSELRSLEFSDVEEAANLIAQEFGG
ncbi:hypothetical protein [Litoreibacter halocynthiae]|uniref:hypothetical protein n=1 Tax=Litoreibacter halocynthiae TaxID=1242689 RepID=UPI00248F995D|nr:hypothetical protein [Litoreibacter halocynthiae]